MNLTSGLKIARVYQAFQDWLGFSNSRKIAIDAYISFRSVQKIYDIGCGPGHIIKYLPENIDYHGFDISSNYIDFAKKTYGHRGKFHCSPFDDSVVQKLGPADLIMFNGVLHHMSDPIAQSVLSSASKALSPDGQIFTFDGCYQKGQSAIAKVLKDLDRGKFVRNEGEYLNLLKPYFDEVMVHIREDISALPYTFIIMQACNGGK